MNYYQFWSQEDLTKKYKILTDTIRCTKLLVEQQEIELREIKMHLEKKYELPTTSE